MNKNKRFSIGKEQVSWGITAFAVICMSIIFYLILTKMSTVTSALDTLSNILMPVILGTVIAYVLLPVYNALETRIEEKFRKRLAAKWAHSLSKAISTVMSLLLLIVVVGGLLVAAGPQVVDSLIRIAESIPGNVDKLSAWVSKMLEDYPEIAATAMNAINNFEQTLMDTLVKYVNPVLEGLIGGITLGVINTVNFLFDFVIGLIVCVYMLNGKENFSSQAKKAVYAAFKTERANYIISDTRRIHRIFSGFISGKLLDSLIIGLITFVVLSVMKMPYGVMISVIVGVTNVIPFFGPFIGAIPSAIIVFTVDPLKSLYFVICIIIIQQFDGNILGPKILGDSTGLPSFWVLFAILVGGGLFGFVGMVLGVPVFATIYMFISRGIDNALIRRNMPYNTDIYSRVSTIDPDSGEFIMKDSSEA